MKDDLNKLLPKLKRIAGQVIKYKSFLFFLGLMLIYGFLVFRINQLSNKTPSSADIDATQQTTNRLHIDQSAIDKIKQLQDNSVQVKALFNSARDNPFHE